MFLLEIRLLRYFVLTTTYGRNQYLYITEVNKKLFEYYKDCATAILIKINWYLNIEQSKEYACDDMNKEKENTYNRRNSASIFGQLNY